MWYFQIGNHINIQTGEWTANDCTIGSGVDSYFEYLAKGAILFRDAELMNMLDGKKNAKFEIWSIGIFLEYVKAIDKHLSDGSGWFVFANYEQGRKTLPLFASLDAFYPGLLVRTFQINFFSSNNSKGKTSVLVI